MICMISFLFFVWYNNVPDIRRSTQRSQSGVSCYCRRALSLDEDADDDSAD